MFLKGSFSFFILLFSLVMSSINPLKDRTMELEIPNLNYQENIKVRNNAYLLIEEELDSLKTNDKILIKKGKETFYYKVITKYEKNREEVLPILEEEHIALIEKNQSTLQTIIIAVNTGKLVKI